MLHLPFYCCEETPGPRQLTEQRVLMGLQCQREQSITAEPGRTSGPLPQQQVAGMAAGPRCWELTSGRASMKQRKWARSASTNDLLHPARLHLPKIPQLPNIYQLGTKCSNIPDYGGQFSFKPSHMFILPFLVTYIFLYFFFLWLTWIWCL